MLLNLEFNIVEKVIPICLLGYKYGSVFCLFNSFWTSSWTRIFFIVLVVLGLLLINNLSSLGTLLRLLVLIRLGLIELRLISPLLTALLQAQPYLLFGGQWNSIDLRIPLDCIVVIAGPELFLLNPFSMYFSVIPKTLSNPNSLLPSLS